MARLRLVEDDSDQSLPEVETLLGRRTSPRKARSQRGAVGTGEEAAPRKRLTRQQKIVSLEAPTTLTSHAANVRAKPSPSKAVPRLQRPLASLATNPLLLPVDTDSFDFKKIESSSRKKIDLDRDDGELAGNAQSTEPKTLGRLAKEKVKYAISPDSPTLSDTLNTIERVDSDNGLSDFVVSDDASETELRLPPRSHRKPKNDNARRPLRARRQVMSDDDDSTSPEEDRKARSRLQGTNAGDVLDAFRRLSLGEEPPKRKGEVPPITDFPKLEPDAILTYSPSPKRSPSKTDLDPTRFTTPPTSPSKPRLKSPTKGLNRIPQSPHRPSIDAFWTQDVINDWNDQYSPQKTAKSRNRFPLLWRNNSDDAELSPSDSSPHKSRSPSKSPSKKEKGAQAATRRNWDASKEQIARDFLTELDQKVTNGQLAALSASTGGVQLVWSKTLNTTAGRARWKREAIRSLSADQQGTKATTYKHHASIDLSVKILTSSERLINVLAHEFCHLANFMVSNVRDQPHGASFKAWARKVMDAFKDRGIVVTTKHGYEIDFKYVWVCEECGVEYKRHSKSIDTGRCRCGVGACGGKLVQVKPAPRGGKTNNGEMAGADEKSGGMNRRVGGKYQAFVKEKYKEVKKENPSWKMGEIMAELAKRYKEEKEKEENAGYDKGKDERGKTGTAPQYEDDIVVVDEEEFVLEKEPAESADIKESGRLTQMDDKKNKAQLIESKLLVLTLD